VLRGFYKELKKDQQNSAGTSLNLSNGSNNADETRYTRHLELIQNLLQISNVDQFVYVCKQ